ncbi:MAG TPA: GNAT family N-acetyltransferase [Edaphocola sp.]|nr:GNAT family N-acetyltransferase [Edaphocola sp.]
MQRFSVQTRLENDKVMLLPLEAADFEAVYIPASNPEVWNQHPNKERWQRSVFENFFNGALESKGAFKIMDKKENLVIGCTRFYDYDQEDDSIYIGYTYFGKDHWGQGFNREVKHLMLDYIFQYVSKVKLHIGAENYRSQSSIEKIGAVKIAEEKVAYFGESTKLNFLYLIEKEKWRKTKGA